MIKIILADDHTSLRSGIRLLLEANNMHVVAEASDGNEVLQIVGTLQDVDIVLTDNKMPGMDGLTLISNLKIRNPRLNVVMLSMYDDINFIQQAFDHGASAYLSKTSDSEELVFALERVASGGNYLGIDLSMKLLSLTRHKWENKPSLPNVEFTDRELEIIQLIAQGMTNAEISETLFLSKRTVEGHRQTILNKTGSRNTASLIKHAVMNGIIA